MSLLLAFLLSLASPPTSAGTCTSVPGSELVLQKGVVLMLGEIHGTVEAPKAVGNLACLALNRGLTTTVGLELPQSDQAAVERFLNGQEDPGDRKRLLELDFWSREYQDGRSSQAMLDLLDYLRKLRAGSLPIRVVLLDEPQVPSRRDRAMADRLRVAAAGSQDGLIISLTGNLHNRLTRGSNWDSEYEPMGFLLKRELADRRLVSLELTHQGGQAWICQGSAASDCGPVQLKGKEGILGIELASDSSDAPFSGSYQLGPISASPPASPLRQPAK